MDEATLARVEEQRLQLEANIATLRKGLRHWQTLEIDYEGLKEEFLGLPESASSEQCLQAANDFKPELVDAKELQTLLLDKANGHKKPSQLVDLFAKRSEYVLRNIESIRKQLSNAEKKRNALLLAENPDFQDDAGLPLKEITEELDDEGEVISSKVQAPGENASKLVDVLRKAGVADLPVDKKGADLVGDSGPRDSDNLDATHDEVDKKTLGLASNRAEAPLSERESDGSSVEGESQQGTETIGPTNPMDTADDAALRQEMLQYGLGEVGAIVAELDLEEDTSDVPYDEYDENEEISDYDEDEDFDSEQSEDERGALKSSVMSDRYVRKMESLQKRFASEGLQNLGPAENLPDGVTEQSDRPPAAEAARKAALARAESEETKISQKPSQDEEKPAKSKSAKKQVAFAKELDIATPEPIKPTTEAGPAPITDSIIERSSSTTNLSTMNTHTHPLPPHSKKISKFKASRLSTPQTPMFPPPNLDFPPPQSQPSNPPTSSLPGPPKSIISASLIERAPSSTTTSRSEVTAPDPSDFDESLHRREIALEYQRARNRRIHQQGGYVRGGEQDNYGDEYAALPVEDSNTGKTRKVSRFKAARIGMAGEMGDS